MMVTEKIKADIAIIGAGIAGLSLALRSWQHGLRPVVLDDARQGTTYSATGIMAPRLDYMLRDIAFIPVSDNQCRLYAFMFPNIVRSRRFLIPINPGQKYMFSCLEALLRKYDEMTPNRRRHVPASSRLSQSELERQEPNIRKSVFDGAFCLWELTADPVELLCGLEQLNKQVIPSYARIQIDRNTLEFKSVGKRITEVKAITFGKGDLTVKGDANGLIVVNSSGPWIQNVVAPLGINLDIELYLGIQMSIAGYYFESGIITFNEKGVYCICLPKGNYVQIGPTNTLYTGHPDNFYEARDNIDSLLSNFKSVLDSDVSIGEYRFLKSGLRVKPAFGDTNRPIIWSHKFSGLENLYTLFPGKMSLGLLAADEMMRTIAKDGWYKLKCLNPQTQYALDGNKKTRNNFFLKKEHLRSLAKSGLSVLLYKYFHKNK